MRIYNDILVYCNDGCSTQESISFLSMSPFYVEASLRKKARQPFQIVPMPVSLAQLDLAGMQVVCSQCFGFPKCFSFGLIFGVVEDVEGDFAYFP